MGGAEQRPYHHGRTAGLVDNRRSKGVVLGLKYFNALREWTWAQLWTTREHEPSRLTSSMGI